MPSEHRIDEPCLIALLRQRNTIGLVYPSGDNGILASMIYSLHKTHIELVSLRVRKDIQGRGIGRAMIERLVSKLSSERRNRVISLVPAEMLDPLLFFKSMGFYGEQAGDDWIAMTYHCDLGVRQIQELLSGAGRVIE